jgi:hypothetical protein
MPADTSLKPYVDELSVGAEEVAASPKNQTGLLPGRCKRRRGGL